MDLKITELRVGNIIRHNVKSDMETESGFCEPNEDVISEDDMNIFLITDQLKDAEPVKLTDDWLLKFGFTREDKTPSKEHGQYFSKWVMDYKYSFAHAPFREDWGFYHSYTDANDDADNNRFDFISCGIKYVHQLQNLYFALTGTELVVGAGQEKV